MRQAYDVCVFGSGPAGSATAARLADGNLSVLVLDRAPRRKPWGGETFSGAIRHPLESLGLWESFCTAGHVAGYEQRSAWGGDSWTKDSIFNPHGSLWHVDRERFDADLRHAVQARGVEVRNYHGLDALQRVSEEWRLVLDEDREIFSRYLVDATGRACALGRRLGLRPRIYDRLIAFTALIPRNPNPEYDHAMVIEATAQGWWYAAPVPQGHVLAFFTDADLVPPGLPRSLKTAAANSAFVPPPSGQGWLPVGDACAAHDPLCGWGVCRAMTNGILAADAIGRYLKNADTSLLDDYQRHCRNQFQDYLEGLSRHYSYERRWSSCPFWERRSTFPVRFA